MECSSRAVSEYRCCWCSGEVGPARDEERAAVDGGGGQKREWEGTKSMDANGPSKPSVTRSTRPHGRGRSMSKGKTGEKRRSTRRQVSRGPEEERCDGRGEAVVCDLAWIECGLRVDEKTEPEGEGGPPYRTHCEKVDLGELHDSERRCNALVLSEQRDLEEAPSSGLAS